MSLVKAAFFVSPNVYATQHAPTTKQWIWCIKKSYIIVEGIEKNKQLPTVAVLWRVPKGIEPVFATQPVHVG